MLNKKYYEWRCRMKREIVFVLGLILITSIPKSKKNASYET